MLIRSEYDIQFHLPAPLTMLAMLRLHPSLESALDEPEILKIEHIDLETKREIEGRVYLDSFGNRCLRFSAPAGALRLAGSSILRLQDQADPIGAEALQHQVEDLPDEMLQFLLSSRYCEVDRMSQIACELFGSVP